MRARKARRLGALAGLPMTIKDGFDVENMPAISGNPALQEPAEELRRRRYGGAVRDKAGAVIWGKTNVPFMLGDIQSYNAIYGTTNNPYDVTRVAGRIVRRRRGSAGDRRHAARNRLGHRRLPAASGKFLRRDRR